METATAANRGDAARRRRQIGVGEVLMQPLKVLGAWTAGIGGQAKHRRLRHVFQVGKIVCGSGGGLGVRFRQAALVRRSYPDTGGCVFVRRDARFALLQTIQQRTGIRIQQGIFRSLVYGIVVASTHARFHVVVVQVPFALAAIVGQFLAHQTGTGVARCFQVRSTAVQLLTLTLFMMRAGQTGAAELAAVATAVVRLAVELNELRILENLVLTFVQQL